MHCENLPRGLGAKKSEKREASVDIKTGGVPFVTDTGADKDLCRHPEYKDMHGLLMSPTTFVLVDGAVPVLSTAMLSTMGDVAFPSPGYGDDRFRYSQRETSSGTLKKNNLYWAGSTTGVDGRARKVGKTITGTGSSRWRRAWRAGREHWYLREQGGFLRRIASTEALSKDLFDVAFTAVIQCDRTSATPRRIL